RLVGTALGFFGALTGLRKLLDLFAVSLVRAIHPSLQFLTVQAIEKARSKHVHAPAGRVNP
ncbi:MAG: hypothetical protein ACE5GT_15010, partial [Rhodospirillales bacterium]